MDTKMSEKWTAQPLGGDERFMETYRSFLEGSNQHDFTTKKVIEVLSKSAKKNIKWLSVGCGLGDWERKVSLEIRKKLPEVKIELLEGIEPNPDAFSYLEENVFKRNMWGDDLSSIRLANTPLTSRTKFTNTYDLITVSHVFYYINTPEERQGCFSVLQDVLTPGGVLLIIHDIRYLGPDIQSHSFRLFKHFGSRIVVDRSRESGHAEGDYSLTGYEIYKEFRQVLKEGLEAGFETYGYHVDLGTLEEDDDKGSISPAVVNILSFLLQCDVGSLPKSAILEMLEWLKKNADMNEEDGSRRKLMMAGATLTFKNKKS